MANEQDNNSEEHYSDQVFHQLLTLMRMKRRYDHQLENAQGIKPRDFSVLRFLAETGPVKVSRIQTYLHHSPSTTSTLIAQLEAAGYVTRTRSKKDNRVVIVALTDAGRAIGEQAPFGGLPLLRRQLSQLSLARLAEIDGVLQELVALMEMPES